jgi:CRP-like cAMP-binding protein
MNSGLLLDKRSAADLQAQAEFKDWLHRLVTGAAELHALAAGEVDAVMDPESGSAILLPEAQTALKNSSERKRVSVSGGAGRAKHTALAHADVPNHLLAALPAKVFARLRADLEPVELNYGEVLYEPGNRIRHVYFPTDCLVSLLTTVEGHAVEVALVGREGMVGSSLALGIAMSPVRAVVQGTGTALRIKSARFLLELRRSAALQRVLLHFTGALMIQIGQTAACNRFHVVQARLARWLLMTRERLPSDAFYLTHAFLADMLGVQRAGVTLAASELQRRKLIYYRRGAITILDRQGLEAAACSCYRRVQLMMHGGAQKT